jgi:lysophospholipase L1-like esterase
MNLTMSLVAVGDSVTEGVGDPGRDGLQGWVHHLADEAGLQLVANLARAGARVADVRRHQLERAVAAEPDVVTCAIGVNDVLRPRCDVDAVADVAVGLGAMMRANPNVLEVDINPLVVHAEGEGAVALDALFVTASPGRFA